MTWKKQSFFNTIITFGLIFGFYGVSFAQSEADVSLVKEGHFLFDKGITIGSAFDTYKYSKETTWKSYKGDKGRRIVEVNIMLDKEKIYKENISLRKSPIYEDIEYLFVVRFFISNNNFELYESFLIANNTKDKESKDKQLKSYNALSQESSMNIIRGIYIDTLGSIPANIQLTILTGH